MLPGTPFRQKRGLTGVHVWRSPLHKLQMGERLEKAMLKFPESLMFTRCMENELPKKKKNFFKGWEKQSENPRKRGKRAERSPLSKKGSQIKERTDKKSNRICYCLQQPENMVITFSSALLKKSLDVSE